MSNLAPGERSRGLVGNEKISKIEQHQDASCRHYLYLLTTIISLDGGLRDTHTSIHLKKALDARGHSFDGFSTLDRNRHYRQSMFVRMLLALQAFIKVFECEERDLKLVNLKSQSFSRRASNF